VFPVFASGYLLAVGFLILYFAYVGQAWNVMMGFAGQLSLGHSLYVGLGAYAAAALYVHYGVSPWIGLGASIAFCVLAGAVIGFLAFAAANAASPCVYQGSLRCLTPSVTCAAAGPAIETAARLSNNVR